MNTLAVAVCEDSAADRDRLADSFEAAGIPCSCDWFEDGETFLQAFYAGKYDIVFLDIYMSGASGIDVAGQVRRLDSDVVLALVTTSNEHALDGYRNRVERYILKPYADEDVREALELGARRALHTADQRLRLPNGDGVAFAHVCFLEQHNHSVVVHLINAQEIRCTGKLDEIEQGLPTPPFFRCHKSYLVNLQHAVRLDKELNLFEMECGSVAYVRRGSMPQAKRLFEKTLIERTRRLTGRRS